MLFVNVLLLLATVVISSHFRRGVYNQLVSSHYDKSATVDDSIVVQLVTHVPAI